MPGGTIVDRPRFAWRGAMLDVARHFFAVGRGEALHRPDRLYKINHLHLHLTDDQGWRLAIARLAAAREQRRRAPRSAAARAASTPQAEYAELVAYAAARYITIVPEIDMPGHTNAALASYPELELRRQRAAALHRHRGRVQLALRREGGHVRVRRGRDRRGRGADAGPVPAHRRRRGARHGAGRLRVLHPPRADDRPQARQAHGRLARDGRASILRRVVDRAVLAQDPDHARRAVASRGAR